VLRLPYQTGAKIEQKKETRSVGISFIQGENMENTSGQGRSALVPPEVDRWNWGAFLLNWVWGIGNSTFIALLMFVPFVNFVMPFVLGFKGSSWAWRNKRWQSIEDFKRVQRKWALWSLPVLAAIAFLIGGVFFLAMASMKNSDAYRLGVSKLQSNADAIAVLGAPVSTGFPTGKIEVSGPSGKAALSFGVGGSKTKGTVYLLASKTLGTWKINRIELKVQGQRSRIDLNKIGRTPPAASKPVVHSQVALVSQSKPATASASESFGVETDTGTKRGSRTPANTGGAVGAGGAGPATGVAVGGITAGMEAAAVALTAVAVAALSTNATNNPVSTTTMTTTK
jgi:hypothetical protein